ncbi:unnamed protein product [Oikopleura dioica]|uniref:Uncharacterized protein n=1 Tax=Oikopleura dioica TaxID=34765 RepID=E4Y4Z0_OIKDI|nr:unnamed protein product [Oikopleura dioica]
MEEEKYSVFSPLYRREVGNMEDPASFYDRVNEEVADLTSTIPQTHHSVPADLTAAEQEKYWKEHADRTRFLIAQNARPSYRAPSPEYIPEGGNAQFYSPKQPLGPHTYRSGLHVAPYGVPGQFALYANHEKLLQRCETHLRVGRPYFEVRQEEVYSQRGQPHLHRLVGFQGRFALFSEDSEAIYTEAQLNLVRAGLEIANSCMDLGSEHFRRDLFSAVWSGYENQDRGVGFTSLVGKNMTKYTVKENGKDVQKERPTRASEIAFSLTEFRKLYPSFSDRSLVRSLVGCLADELPSTASLLSLEEYTQACRQFFVLPKRRRVAFLLEIYESGSCVGTCIFSTKLHDFTLQFGDHNLDEETYVVDTFDHDITKGPMSADCRLKKNYKTVFAQQQATDALEAQYNEYMCKLGILHQYAESISSAQKLFPLPDRKLRLLTLSYYNEQLEDSLVQKILTYHSFQQFLRSKVQLQDQIAKKKETHFGKVPLEPGFTNVRMGSELLRVPSSELVQIDLYHRNEVLPAERVEVELRRKLRTLGYIWTRPTLIQNFMAKLKAPTEFLCCRSCQTKIYQPDCECLTSWLDRQLLNPIEEVNFQSCENCQVNAGEMFPCECIRLEMAALAAELLNRPEGAPALACQLCRRVTSCACPLVCLVEHASTDFSQFHELEDFFTPRPMSDVVSTVSDRMSSITTSLREAGPVSSIITKTRDEPTARHALYHPTQPNIYGKGRPSAPSAVENDHLDDQFNDNSTLGDVSSINTEYFTASEGDNLHGLGYDQASGLEDANQVDPWLDSSLVEVPDMDTTADVAALADCSLDSTVIEEAHDSVTEDALIPLFTDSVVVGQFETGHLSRAFSRKTDVDPLKAAAAELSFKKKKSRSVEGFATIPSSYYPFNGENEGTVIGVPQSFSIKDDKGNFVPTTSTPALYSASASGVLRGSSATVKSMQQRYTATRADGTVYCPRGTLEKVLRDLGTAPIRDVPFGLTPQFVSGQIGARHFLRSEAKKMSSDHTRPQDQKRRSLRIRSFILEEPTDLPPTSRRPWVHRLVEIDSHGCMPPELSLQFAGQLAWSSKDWQEFSLPNGRRALKSVLPGKAAGTFSLSTGSAREFGQWNMKLGARYLTLFLCGGGIRQTLQQASASKIESTPIAALREAQLNNLPLVRDASEGSNPRSTMVSDDFHFDDFHGKWERISEPGKADYFQGESWPGFNFAFKVHGFSDGYGHRATYTAGDFIYLETMQAIYGSQFWLVSHFNAIRKRYLARCAARKILRSDTDKDFTRCFGALRFSVGSLDPRWATYVPMVHRVLGKDWKIHLENLIFDLNDGAQIMYRHADTVGPTVEKFLVEENNFPNLDEDIEQLGRVDEQGRIIFLEEEPVLSQLTDLQDYGHFYAESTRSQRHPMSTKFYTSLEKAGSEMM